MYRVVLIDDEPLIVEGLRKVVPWKDYDCEVAAAAEDAASGARLIREIRPHILFTDIRMPGEDGLTMLAGLRSEFPDMQVTVLSGYREFSYAQEAIRLGVTRFLVKPSRMDEICESLAVMTGRLALTDPGSADSGRDTALEDDGNPHGSESEAEEEKKEPEQAGRFVVRQAIAYMEKHYKEKLTLQDVADACYVSQWHLSKLLNRYMHKSFYDILHSQRIQAAKKLLADPSLRIGEICEMVGYADVAHFSRVFKKLEGMSANEYRNRL
ncbi:MAG: response regulator [Lachnospiraceae bacterium]|nr:response regulator [Lachnospiraceae bacterium]